MKPQIPPRPGAGDASRCGVDGVNALAHASPPPCSPSALRLSIITTGGTIEKTYDEAGGALYNAESTLPSLLAQMRLPDLCVTYDHPFSKDSLDMDEADRRTVLACVRKRLADCDAILIIHGTDTLALTGELLHREIPELRIPIVMTGAMKPLVLRDTDAFQNVTESLLACRLLESGVYVVMHNRVLKFPGVVKDRSKMTFTHAAC